MDAGTDAAGAGAGVVGALTGQITPAMAAVAPALTVMAVMLAQFASAILAALVLRLMLGTVGQLGVGVPSRRTRADPRSELR